MTRACCIIPLPWTTVPLSSNRVRGNPYAQAAKVKAALEEARGAVRDANIPLHDTAHVTLHYRPKDRRRRDADGLFPVLKVVQDALVHEGVLGDDSWAHVPRAACHIHPPTDEGAAMWLEIEDVA